MRKPWQIWLSLLLCLVIVVPSMIWLTYKTIELESLRERDRKETELARQEAELQERISSALYRMDLKLIPLVSQEAARPHYFYEPFYQLPAGNGWLQNAVASAPNPSVAPNGPTTNDEQTDAQTIQTNESPQQVQMATGPGSSLLDALSQLPATQNGEASQEFPSPLLISSTEFVKLHFQVDERNNITSPQRPVGRSCQQAIACCGITQSFIDDNSAKIDEATKFVNYQSIVFACPPNPTNVQVTQTQPQQTEQSPQQQMRAPDISFPQQSAYVNPQNDKILNNFGNGNTRKYQGKTKQSKPVSQPQNKQLVQRSRGQGRYETEFNRRAEQTKELATQQAMNWNMSNSIDIQYQNLQSLNANNNDAINASTLIREGVMQPVWLGDELILARRVVGDNRLQCCWLDWNAIQTALQEEIKDLLPEVSFRPVRDEDQLDHGTALTTLPVQLVVDSQKLLSTLSLEFNPVTDSVSGLRFSLWLAWLGLGVAALASAFLLHGVMKLSERRAAFVSAVTHELRTPLTTFRMYAEMLAEKMVPEGKQQEYANTLRVQADRLSHLVENVLQFARLERGSELDSPEQISITALVGRFSSRLEERAEQAGMKLIVDLEPEFEALTIATRPSQVEQILFNLVDNACKYAKPSKDNRIEIRARQTRHSINLEVRDHGPGVCAQVRKKMFQPFCKSDQEAANTAPGVGLGLALCRRMADSLGGKLNYESSNDGAVFVLELPRIH